MYIFTRPQRQFAKAEQLSLFDMPVHVAASTDKNGVTRAAHMAIRKKRVAVPVHAHTPQGKLDGFIAKHGGPAHLKAALSEMTPEQRAKLIDAMAHLDGLNHAAVMAKLDAPVAQMVLAPVAESAVAAEPAAPAPEPAPAAPELVEHVTRKGKTLRGVVRTDLTAEQAKAIDEYTFKKDGGWFIREKYLEVASKLDAAKDAGVITDEQHQAARAGAAKDGPAGAMAALTPAVPEPVTVAPTVAGPQEGERNADGLVFRDGRWHREDGYVAAPEPVAAQPGEAEETGTADAPEPAPIQSPEIEIAEDRQDLADEMARNPHSDRAKKLMARIALAEAGQNTDEDDPNSPMYRFKDTGVIAGSRKERAALQIRQAAKSGQRLRATDIDWSEIEQNPREAEALITKSNLFGQVDWAALRESGMEPGAGFLIDRVYAAVALEPDGATAQKRHDYALGLETLRDRLERCTTPQHVTDVLKDIADEISGEMLSATESDEYKAIMERYYAARMVAKEAEKEQDALYQAWNRAQSQYMAVQSDKEKRQRRGWKPDPELDARAVELAAASEVANAAYVTYRDAHPELRSEKRDLPGGYVTYENDLEYAARQIRNQADAIMQAAKARNVMSNPLTRAWVTLGGRFLSVVHWRSARNGSEAFAKHVTAAKTGKVADWSWAEKEALRGPKTTRQQVHFQLKVAENFDRVGGRAVHVDSTSALKERFNLRDIQSGNWVLNDVDSAAFHVQKSAEAFSDLADIMGVPDELVSMNGRLAMSFGARGRGNAGWKGAARAHWEPVQRVINLTKMGGGGALAHEWFHALDNMMREAEGAGPAAAEDHVTENPALLPAGEVRDAVDNLRNAMTSGTMRRRQAIDYSDRDLRTARYNIDGRNGPIAVVIKSAANVTAAVQAVDNYYTSRYGAPEDMRRKVKTEYETWRRLAAAYKDGNQAGGTAEVLTGAPMSSFQYEAINLDGGENGKYWSEYHELAARAFQSYVEDKLEAVGRKNDYLSWGADNKYHVDPLFGPTFPYPEGEERDRINEAFDRLFAVLAKRGTLAKAAELMAA